MAGPYHYFDATGTTRVGKDGANNLEFRDAVTGTKTLAQLAAGGSPYTIKRDPQGNVKWRSTPNIPQATTVAQITASGTTSATTTHTTPMNMLKWGQVQGKFSGSGSILAATLKFRVGKNTTSQNTFSSITFTAFGTQTRTFSPNTIFPDGWDQAVVQFNGKISMAGSGVNAKLINSFQSAGTTTRPGAAISTTTIAYPWRNRITQVVTP